MHFISIYDIDLLFGLAMTDIFNIDNITYSIF